MQRYTIAGVALLAAGLLAMIIKGIVIHPALTKVDSGLTNSVGPYVADVNFVAVIACLGIVVGILFVITGLSGAPKGVLGYRP